MQNTATIKVNKGEFYLNKGLDFTRIFASPIHMLLYRTDNEEQAFAQLSEAQQAFWLWYTLDWQIRDSGIIYYFDNRNGDKLPEVITALHYFGESDAADLLENALPLFEDYKTFYADGNRYREIPYSQYTNYADLDEEYMEMADEILERIENFIRERPALFAADEENQPLATAFNGTCTTLHENGTIKERFSLLNGIPDGPYDYYHDNGVLGEHKMFSNGIESAARESFREDGSPLRSIIPTSNPDLVERTDYHSNGQPSRKELYSLEEEAPTGHFKEWHANGQLLRSGSIINGYQYEGEYLTFYEDGSKKEESFYKDGEENVRNYWSKEGEQLVKEGNGKKVATSVNEVSNSLYRHEILYKEGRKHGTASTYIDGILDSTIDYVGGILHGFSRSFYKNGNMKEELIMEDGSWQKRKKFPLAKKIKVVASIHCEMEDIMLTNRGLLTAECYPTPLNNDEIATSIQLDISLFKGYDHDYVIDHSFLVFVDKDGNVTEARFSGGSNAHFAEEVSQRLLLLKFEPGQRGGEKVASHSWAKVEYRVEEL